jgi:trimeric autotransporter adhesin
MMTVSPSRLGLFVGLLLTTLSFHSARAGADFGPKSTPPMPWELARGDAFPWHLFPGRSTPQEPAPLSPSLPLASGDELWWDGFGLPVIDGYVVCMAQYQGSVVVGGRFRYIGTVQVNNIARWDGTHWSGFGDGIDGQVNALSVFQGELVAAGSFTSADGVPAQGIARWNGQAWSALGEGLQDDSGYYGYVTALTSHDDDLIAGGDFSVAGGTPVHSIARWNGATWDSVGAGFNGLVTSLVVAMDTLYAGGEFTGSGDTPLSNVARWDGSGWADLGGGVGLTPVYGSNGRVTALASYQGSLIVGGYFDQAGDSTVSNLAGWNGSTWTGLGYAGGVTALGIAQNTLFVSTWGALLNTWDGVSWQGVSGFEGYAYTLLGVDSDLYIGGQLLASDESTKAMAVSIARYANGTWHDLATWDDHMKGLAGRYGGPGYVTTLTSYRGKVVAAGSFWYPTDPPAWHQSNGISSWDGERWADLPRIPAGDYSSGVTSLLSVVDTLYAGGYFYAYDSTNQVRPVFRFANDQWTPLGASRFFPNALAVYAGSLLAAGRDSDSTAGVYRWTGTSWQSIGTLSGFIPSANTLSVVDGRLVVCGRFSSVDGVPVSNIAEWDGSHWKPLGAKLPSSLLDGAYGTVYEGKLVVAGPLSMVVRWTGSSWEIMGSLLANDAAISSTGGGLFIGGYYRQPYDPYEGYGVAQWDGHDWVELGSGTNRPVTSFLAHGGALYMGGAFSRAGGKSSFAMARWDGLPSPVTAPAFLAAAPNPFRATTQFSYRATRDGSVRVAVFDLHGREIALLEEGGRTSGIHTVTWNGHDKSGRDVAAGVYFIRAALPGGEVLSRKVVRVR